MVRGSWCVEFFWSGDRWGHRVLLARDGGPWSPVVESVEGTAEEDWPASPPFQSLNVERRAEGDVALLVGMAGKSHWSASVEMDGAGARFDVACRVRGADAGPLTSTYRLLPDAGRVKIEALAGHAPLEARREGAIARLTVRAASDAAAQTVRWRYRIGLPAIAPDDAPSPLAPG